MFGSVPISKLLLGFIAYGLGIYFYVHAQRILGAARTSAYYAVAPFISVFLSLLIFREIPGILFVAALILMLIGLLTVLYFLITYVLMPILAGLTPKG